MAAYTSMETLRFLLHEVHDLSSLFQHEHYQEHDKDSIDILLDAVKALADKDFHPYFREMDEQPATFEDGRITIHPALGAMINGYAELGLVGGPFSFEDGGLQLPGLAISACNHIFEAANNHANGYVGLTTGTANLILSFGSEELKQTYIPKMITAEWTGTMCLTEPQAGSSLSDVATTASPLPDGSYAIKGQKIFISGGDHQFAENIVHLVLARIDGAPAGTKGISLLVVPNLLPTADGGLEDNDVIVAGEFQKMGQRGYATAHLAFGEKGNCRGYLVGQPHQGLRYMFQMMNEARIAVGVTATSIATAAYHASLQYARERPQGRRINDKGKKDLTAEQTLIINHPDVRRMLMLQKAVTEASLSLIFEASKAHDMHKATGDSRHHLLLELLTPIVKTYPSEMGRISVSNGLQVLGGYGFCSEFVLQQYYRDIRICAIYEGTTGIQSLDLLGRKVTMRNGAALQILMEEVQQTIQAAATHQDLRPYADALTAKLGLTQKVLGALMPYAMKGEYERYLMDASVFMEFASTVIIGWQWLKMSVAAKEALLSGKSTQTEAFYQSKVDTMRFYFKYEMPKTTGLAETLMNGEVLTILEEKELVF